MTKELLEKIKISVENYNNKNEEKTNRIVNMMYENIWNIILINFECYYNKQSFSLYLEDELIYFMILVTEKEYNKLTEKLKNDGFIFSYTKEKERTIITISRNKIINHTKNINIENNQETYHKSK